MNYFYGPVQSRRLGLSLGVDLCTDKQCTLDCVYCQVGRTPKVSPKRFEQIDLDIFKRELKDLVVQFPHLDYITFAGSGEPTLHKSFDLICNEIKSIAPDVKLALITNSTLLTEESVRREISKIDLLVPSLDSARQASFEKINRPVHGLKVADIIDSLKRIKKESNVEMWLEIMLLGGVNDSYDDLIALKDAVIQIQPDKVQINLPVRPTLDPVNFPEQETVNNLIELLKDHVEVICDKKIADNTVRSKNIEESILSYVSRRPASLDDLKALVSLDTTALKALLDNLENKKCVRVFEHQGKVFVKAYETK